MLLPPCFTVGMVVLGWWGILVLHQTWRFTWQPKSSILVSSEQSTFLCTSEESATCLLVNSNKPFPFCKWVKTFSDRSSIKPSSMACAASCGHMDSWVLGSSAAFSGLLSVSVLPLWWMPCLPGLRFLVGGPLLAGLIMIWWCSGDHQRFGYDETWFVLLNNFVPDLSCD